MPHTVLGAGDTEFKNIKSLYSNRINFPLGEIETKVLTINQNDRRVTLGVSRLSEEVPLQVET